MQNVNLFSSSNMKTVIKVVIRVAKYLYLTEWGFSCKIFFFFGMRWK